MTFIGKNAENARKHWVPEKKIKNYAVNSYFLHLKSYIFVHLNINITNSQL